MAYTAHPLHLSTLANHYIRRRPVQYHSNVFYLPDHVHPIDNFSECNVFPI